MRPRKHDGIITLPRSDFSTLHGVVFDISPRVVRGGLPKRRRTHSVIARLDRTTQYSSDADD
jgi:hypothetical protein